MATDAGGSPFFYVESDGLCCEDVTASQCSRPSGLLLDVLDLEESTICRDQCDLLSYRCLGYDFRPKSPPPGTCTVLGPNITSSDVYSINMMTQFLFEWISGPAKSIEGGQPNSLFSATCFLKVLNTNTTEVVDPCPDHCNDPCNSAFVETEGCELCHCIYHDMLTTALPSLFPTTTLPTSYAPTISSNSTETTSDFSFTTSSMATTTTTTTKARDYSGMFTASPTQVLETPSTQESKTSFWRTPMALVVFGAIGCVVIVIVWIFLQSDYNEEKELTSWADKARRVSTYFGVGSPGQTQPERQGEPGALDLQLVDMQMAMMEQEMQNMHIQQQLQEAVIQNQALQLQNNPMKAKHRKSRPRGRNSQMRDGRSRGMGGKGMGMHGMKGVPQFHSPHKRKRKKPDRAKKNQMQQLQMQQQVQMQLQMMQNPQMNQPRKTVSRKTKRATKGRRKKKQRQQQEDMMTNQGSNMMPPGGPGAPQMMQAGPGPGPQMSQQNAMRSGPSMPQMSQQNTMRSIPSMGSADSRGGLPPPHIAAMRGAPPQNPMRGGPPPGAQMRGGAPPVPPPQPMPNQQQAQPPQIQRQMTQGRKQMQQLANQMQQQPPFMQQVQPNQNQLNGMNIPHLYE